MSFIIDPYRFGALSGITNVKLLSHFDGADASTTFTDVIGHTLTANGNAQLDTAQAKWGPSALLLDGTGDYVSSPDSADWSLTTVDFCIECWVRFNVATGTQVFLSHYENTTNQRAWYFRLTTGNLLTFQCFETGNGGNAQTIEGSWTPSTGVWYHLCAERASNNIRVFADGVVIDSQARTLGITNSNQALIIGAVNSSGFTQFFNGWLDDVRMTVGASRYGGAFTPPSGPFPDS